MDGLEGVDGLVDAVAEEEVNELEAVAEAVLAGFSPVTEPCNRAPIPEPEPEPEPIPESPPCACYMSPGTQSQDTSSYKTTRVVC